MLIQEEHKKSNSYLVHCRPIKVQRKKKWLLPLRNGIRRQRCSPAQRSARQAKTMCNLCDWLERQQGALHGFF